MRPRLFFLTYVAANLSLVLYGVFVLVMPSILLKPFALHIYQFPDDATRVTSYLGALFRLLGFFNIIPGMVGLVLLRRVMISPESWVLRIVIVSTAFAYLGPIVFDNTVGSIGFFEILEHILFVFVILLGAIAWRDRDGKSEFWLFHSPKTTPRKMSKAAKASAAYTINHLGATRAGVWAIKHLVSPLQRWIYRGTGGRIFSTIGSSRHVLLLTTKGRRTGKDRTTPVFYLRDGESVVICNVNPGFERTNPWVINLRANPLAKLQIGRYTGRYQAREATDAEVELYWPRLVALWPAYQSHYDRGGHRSIFVLDKA